MKNKMAELNNIHNCIFNIREEQVMLDSDLALMYQVETRVLNQAVSRNKERFPEDFMFQLSPDEWALLKSQNVTSSWGGLETKLILKQLEGTQIMNNLKGLGYE